MSKINAVFAEKFQQIIDSGRKSAEQVFNRIATEVPEDRIVRGRAMRFAFEAPRPKLASVHALRAEPELGWHAKEALDADDPRASGMEGADPVAQIMNMVDVDGVQAPAPAEPPAPTEPAPPASLVMSIAEHTQQVHAHALGQLAHRFRLHGVKIPVRYLRALVGSGDPESQAIAEEILNRTADHSKVRDQRFLVRSVGDEARAVMSDRFRRIDCRPILDTLVTFLQDRGMIPIGGYATDTRVQLQFAIPEVFHLTDEESPILIGGIWQNSDFGHGSNGLSIYVKRGWCANGCSSENTMRQVHAGGRLPEDIALAADTLAADTKANQLVMRDTLQAVLSPERVAEVIASLREANITRTTWDAYAPRLKKILGKGELDQAKKAFDGEDVVNLPAGKTQWRMSNAISWLAHSASPSRAIELERLAGSIAYGESRLATDGEVIAA